MITILTSGYQLYYEFTTLYETYVLVPHMTKCSSSSIPMTSCGLRTKTLLEGANHGPTNHARTMLSALFHYKMHAANIMCFLGQTYIGERWDIPVVTEILISQEINPWPITQYLRARKVGCTNHFNAETSRENTMLQWWEGNHSLIKKTWAQSWIQSQRSIEICTTCHCPA